MKPLPLALFTFLITGGFLIPSPAMAGNEDTTRTINLSSYYPSRSGNYDNMKINQGLMFLESAGPDHCTGNEIILRNESGNLQICQGTLGGNFSNFNAPIWDRNSSNIYLNSGISNPVVGIHTETPSASLEIIKDGTTPLLNLSSADGTDGNLFTVTNTGRVGIGKNNPSVTLDVVGNQNVSGTVTATKFVTGQNTIDDPSNNSEFHGQMRVEGNFFTYGNFADIASTGGQIVLQTQNADASWQHVIVIPSIPGNAATFGNVGIRNDNPQAPLDVNGNVIMSGDVSIGGNLNTIGDFQAVGNVDSNAITTGQITGSSINATSLTIGAGKPQTAITTNGLKIPETAAPGCQGQNGCLWLEP